MRFEISGEVSERKSRKGREHSGKNEIGGRALLPFMGMEKKSGGKIRSIFFPPASGAQSRDFSGFPPPQPRQDANCGSMRSGSVR